MTAILSRFPAVVLVVACAGLAPKAGLYAQGQRGAVRAGSVYLSGAAFESGTPVDLSTLPWRFQEGDDPAWADPAFDDSAWVFVRTDTHPDPSTGGAWQGIGWFRLRLEVDSTLHDAILGLALYQIGASEVYLDGEYVGGFGEVGASAGADRPYVSKGIPQSIHLDDRNTHVMAVRYANRAAAVGTFALFQNRSHLPIGFAAVLGPGTEMHNSYVYLSLGRWSGGLLEGVLVLLALLHLLLYSFDRRHRANLFFGLAAASLAVGLQYVGAVVAPLLIVDGTQDWALIWAIAMNGFLLFFLFLLPTLYALFAPRWLRWTWGFVLFLIVIVGLQYAFSASINFAVPLVLFAGLTLLEALRVTGYAIYKRQEGAWILGMGILVTFLAILTQGVMRMDAGSSVRFPLVDGPILIHSDWYFLALVTIPIPFSMSVLLARRFVQRSRRLERELVRVEDLSARTLAQEREKQALIASQNERLEVEVAERTAELKQSLADLKAAQAQLVHAEKMASLGQLTAGIAHEIKNPLNFINNFAEVNEELADELRAAWRNDETDVAALLDDLEQNASVIAQHGRRADSIVRSMMQHASGGAGHYERTAINRLVAEHIDLAYHGKRAQVPELQVEVERDLDGGAGTVEVVPQEIGRVLLNLLSNAFDAVHERAAQDNGAYEPTVAVSTRRSGAGVEIRVSDNGVGIPPSVRDRVFEPFFTTKPTGSGTGLGLSLSYDIVTQGHGGALTVESTEGEGTTFLVTLPVEHGGAASSA